MNPAIYNSRDFQILMQSKTSHLEFLQLESDIKKYCANPQIADKAIKRIQAQHMQIQALQAKLASLEKEKDKCLS